MKLFVGIVCAGLAFAQGPRERTELFGSSGGNIGDRSRIFCCSGTLGGLLQGANGNQYILSNNHVAGRSGQALPGEIISQPGLIDNGCAAGETVANFTFAGNLSTSNVDAAAAQLVPGTMSATGEQHVIGTTSSVIAPPAIDQAVQKHGRTTFYTTGTVTSINTTVRVGYPNRCAALSRSTTYTFTNQIVIGQEAFSAGGDSGSMIFTNDAAKNPVGLLFAGSSTSTIANPAAEVLSVLSAGVGTALTYVGDPVAPLRAVAGPSASEIARANRVRQLRDRELMRDEGVLGVGVGRADDRPTEAVLVIYTDRNRTVNLPDRIDGVRVKRVVSEVFESFGASCCDSCKK
ncbi:MAG: hypothetical protein SFV18_20615 [Bryobacteraceae bacterium]|nr:hypothetical protein [Bryobacteraceae bacterium]